MQHCVRALSFASFFAADSDVLLFHLHAECGAGGLVLKLLLTWLLLLLLLLSPECKLRPNGRHVRVLALLRQGVLIMLVSGQPNNQIELKLSPCTP
jgi:hypothetical protein